MWKALAWTQETESWNVVKKSVIASLTSLTHLSLCHWDVILPEPMASPLPSGPYLQGLKELRLRGLNIKGFPEHLSGAKVLEVLDLSYNHSLEVSEAGLALLEGLPCLSSLSLCRGTCDRGWDDESRINIKIFNHMRKGVLCCPEAAHGIERYLPLRADDPGVIPEEVGDCEKWLGVLQAEVAAAGRPEGSSEGGDESSSEEDSSSEEGSSGELAGPLEEGTAPPQHVEYLLESGQLLRHL